MSALKASYDLIKDIPKEVNSIKDKQKFELIELQPEIKSDSKNSNTRGSSSKIKWYSKTTEIAQSKSSRGPKRKVLKPTLNKINKMFWELVDSWKISK